MKTLTSHTLVAVTLAKGIRAFSAFPCSGLKTHTTPLTVINCPSRRNTHSRKLGTARYMSTGNSVTIKQIDKRALHEIIEDIESTSREESGYVVIDVRNEDEIEYTGKLSECVEILPLPLIAQMGAFSMTEEDFEDNFGFAKPQKDETIVFTCKAGIRSMHAAQYAAMNGYSNLINYTGGAMDWFR